MRNVFDGLNLQVYNAPLDLFVESKIYNEYPEFRAIQLISLFELEQKNIEATNNQVIQNSFPDAIVSINKILNITASFLLKDLYSLDFRKYFYPSKKEFDTAKELFAQFKTCIKDYSPGDEYDLVIRFAEILGVNDFFEIAELAHLGNAHLQSKLPNEKTDSAISGTLDEGLSLIVNLTEAIRFFKNKTLDETKQVAFDIATLGQSGIHPDKTGYKISSIKDRVFSGKELLAFYYVSWAIAFPQMIDKLGLHYSDAYQQAKNLVEKD
jgi:hypothetical protein